MDSCPVYATFKQALLNLNSNLRPVVGKVRVDYVITDVFNERSASASLRVEHTLSYGELKLEVALWRFIVCFKFVCDNELP